LVHDGSAVWANRRQVSDLFCDRSVFHHACRRSSGGTASETIEFTRSARALPACPTALKERRKFAAEDQRWALSVAGLKSALNPCADGVLVNAEQPRNFLDGVAAMDFDAAVVGLALPHD
jgi:hypothetical protein